MNQWIYRTLWAIGLLLIGLGTSSVLRPDSATEDPRYALALRQIAHDYLTANGDCDSVIPPVEKMADGRYLLPFGQELDYTQLLDLAPQSMRYYNIQQPYSLTLEDCNTGEVFLGSLLPSVFLTEPVPILPLDGVACYGREQDERCAHLAIAYHRTAALGQNNGNLLLLLGGGWVLLLLGGTLVARWKKTDGPQLAPAETETDAAPGTQRTLAPDLIYDPLAQTLHCATEQHALTYRENKLFAYLAERPNEVLPRTDIQEAVWGTEGILVGRSLDVFISRLRKKLAGVPGVEIQTVHGVGYRWWVG
ncbi:winged helix-turn-helix domain-containing protein [Neolewinella lacunae]|uniref:Winged helix-turn-helix transcriptional regulator n=1 Tax=Neolewinella lacunae TaxID=1517758 RepID=A0A923PI52_9BACT|nr:winged helix-turn-helix domain-containing protein [Neolewinella lacunae]MBC6993719.1 winged helix-turn-helix transcriptional regulator [Neolewinella lacunae]MDN3635745.1 winged helix-turn-helix domain-containing protein [Neolewinella lacunae]